MATLQIENLPEDLYQSIQRLAAGANLSLSEAVIQMLLQATKAESMSQQTQRQKETEQALDKIRSFPRANPADYGLADSTLLIRADRDR